MKGKIYQKQNGSLVDVTPNIVPVLRYELCEVYYFLNPALRSGFVQAAGGLIANANTLYPAAFQYLQTTEGSALCVTETEWQNMSTAIYYTDASGNQEGWNGVGGVPKFVVDTMAGTIRVPDLRGMYAEAAGLDSLAVGGVHADKIRNITGSANSGYCYFKDPTGAMSLSGQGGYTSGTPLYSNYSQITFDSSRVIPTGSYTVPRAFGALACVYLGS